MTPVTFGRRRTLETISDDTYGMTTTNSTGTPTGEPVESPDPQRVLESIIYELEYLLHQAPFGSVHNLIQLHGALLAYNLGGQAELLPSPSFGLTRRSILEHRVTRAARRIVERGASNTTATMEIAADVVEQYLHLIDPELCTRAA
jgi:hypothetical protein